MKNPIIHELKTWPAEFQAVWDGLKTFDIRRTDRTYNVDHELDLREYISTENRYSGRGIRAFVTYVVRGGEWGLPDDLCVMGIRIIVKYANVEEKAIGEAVNAAAHAIDVTTPESRAALIAGGIPCTGHFKCKALAEVWDSDNYPWCKACLEHNEVVTEHVFRTYSEVKA
jgi:hypothetical protein